VLVLTCMKGVKILMHIFLLAPFLFPFPIAYLNYNLQYHNLGALVWGKVSPIITSFWLLTCGTSCQKQPSRTRSRGVHGSSRGLQTAPRTSFKKGSRAIVTVYDASSLFFIHKELGEKYV